MPRRADVIWPVPPGTGHRTGGAVLPKNQPAGACRARAMQRSPTWMKSW